MKVSRIIVSFILLLSGWSANAQDQHQHEAEEHDSKVSKDHGNDEDHANHGKENDHKDHGKEAAHEEHEEEAKLNVGSDKGILSFSEENGFVLSPEALTNFKIKSITLKGKEPWSVPTTALLLTGDEKNMYRLRGNTFKRIDIEIIRKNSNTVQIKSKDLQSGDSIVIQGVGFLRVAELDVTSGESGHSH
mgnify:CR=1 FL=1